jgi:hypothetical protein
MFSYLSPEQWMPRDHLLRAIRAITDPVLQELPEEFHRLCAAIGQPSIAREKLLGAAVAGMADAEDLESREALGSELHQNAAQRKSPVLTRV